MKNKLGSSIIYNSLGTGLYLFCQWLITFIVVWISGYEVQGILAIAMAISSTYIVIANFNMRGFQASDINNEYGEKTYIYSRIFTSCISLIFVIIYSLIKGYFGNTLLCIIAFMIYKILESLVDVFHGSLQKKWLYNIIGFSMGIRGIISVLSFAVTLYLSNNLLLSLSVMNVFIALFIYFYDYKKYKKIIYNYGKTSKKVIIKLLLYCLPLVIYGFLFNYNCMYPKLALEEILGSTTLGYYTTIATISLIIQTACSFIFGPLVPYFSKLNEENNYNKIMKDIVKILLVIVLITLLGYIFSYYFGNYFFNLLFGSDILNYVYLFKYTVIISGLIAIVWFLGSIIIVKRNNLVLLLGVIVSLIITLILSKMMISNYNLMGIIYTYLISYIVQIVIYFIYVLRRKNDNCNNTNI